MSVKLYMDVHVRRAITSGLRLRGVDVLTAQERSWTELARSTNKTENPNYWDGGKHCWTTPKDMSHLSHPVLLDTERRITDISVDTIKAHASGTTFAQISKKNFRPLPLVVPTSDVMAAYQQATDPLFGLLTACVKENEQLAEMRDYLLPILLSSQVRVRRVG